MNETTQAEKELYQQTKCYQCGGYTKEEETTGLCPTCQGTRY